VEIRDKEVKREEAKIGVMPLIGSWRTIRESSKRSARYCFWVSKEALSGVLLQALAIFAGGVW